MIIIYRSVPCSSIDIVKPNPITYSIGTVIYDLSLIAFSCHYHLLQRSTVMVGRTQGRYSVALQLDHVLLRPAIEMRVRRRKKEE